MKRHEGWAAKVMKREFRNGNGLASLADPSAPLRAGSRGRLSLHELWVPPLPLLLQAVVLFQDFAEAVVGQGDDFVVVDASHGFRGDHGVDDGFFGGLDCC
jgi:hypothetical protein